MDKQNMKKIDDMLDIIHESNEEALYPTDLKEAIIGMVTRFGMEPLVLVDTEKCINIFMTRDGMDRDEAEEFFNFNVIGAWMGDGTPCFATIIDFKPKSKENYAVWKKNRAEALKAPKRKSKNAA